jgi:hypothetical protein
MVKFAPMAAWSPVGEALALGLASGPACIASCGPVLVPSMLAEHSGVRLNARYLAMFLSTRLLGYLLFALIAWQAGSVALPPASRSTVFGTVHLLLAVVLVFYARSVGRTGCEAGCTQPKLVTIGAGGHGVPAAAALGLFSGISLCPPFVAAGVRAAELASASAALLFFATFFVGTSIWFIPLLGFGCLRRNPAIITVARMCMVLIALYYGYAGVMILLGRNIRAS